MYCSDPTPANGSITILSGGQLTDGTFSHSTVVQFGCNDGYTLVTAFSAFDFSIYQTDGTWFPPVPNCILQGNVFCNALSIHSFLLHLDNFRLDKMLTDK